MAKKQKHPVKDLFMNIFIYRYKMKRLMFHTTIQRTKNKFCKIQNIR